MTHKEIQELIKLVNRTDVADLSIQEGDFKLRIRKSLPESEVSPPMVAPTQAPIINVPAGYTSPAPAPAPAPAAAPAPASDSAPQETPGGAPADDESRYVPIKSPMIGTFYRASAPDKPPYVKVGDTVATGDVVCVVEAMKLFNEIESEVSGKIVKVLVEDAQPVEYDQVLYLVDPKG
jgi:acetyl-CoA carboxylase biotin carboxyl carrier protein